MGGRFPEIPMAQFPLDMGRKGAQKVGCVLAIRVSFCDLPILTFSFYLRTKLETLSHYKLMPKVK